MNHGEPIEAARIALWLALLLALGIAFAGGDGAGFGAGALAALALTLHMLVFGGEAARAAFPEAAQRFVLALGLTLIFVAVAAPGWTSGPRAAQIAAAVLIPTAWSLALAALAGRAVTLPDGER